MDTTAQPHRLPIVNSGAAAPPDLLRDRWYPVHSARRLRRRPVSLRRLGRDLVLWRDGDGVARAAPARCPHRGADLGLGRVVGGELQCPYHGFRFAGDGACTAAPCEPGGVPRRHDLGLRTLPLREAHDLLWLWSGPGPARGQPAWFPALPPLGRRAVEAEMIWEVPQGRVMEGMLDLHHAPFAHRRVPGMSRMGPLLDPYRAEIVDGVLSTEGVLRPDDGRAWDGRRGFRFAIDAALPGVLHLRMAPIVGAVAVSPIDGGSTWIWIRYQVDVPIVGKLLAALGLWGELRMVQPDDLRMLASSGDAGWDDYHLVRADGGIARWRRLWHEAAPPAPSP